MDNLASIRSGLLIDDATICKATACTQNHSCLADGACSKCTVFACIDNTLVVRCTSDDPCDYRKTEGGRQTCDCPVRRKIFTKYGY